MERKSFHAAFSNQKDGAGKSAFTTLAANYSHYGENRNVAIIRRTASMLIGRWNTSNY